MDIAEFLTACLDEDEAVAQAAANLQDDPWNGWGFVPREDYRRGGGTITPHIGSLWERESVAHVTRFHLARVLADIAAKRQLLKVHTGDHICAGWSGESYFDEGDPCLTACLMAAPYADRPGYDDAWRIES